MFTSAFQFATVYKTGQSVEGGGGGAGGGEF